MQFSRKSIRVMNNFKLPKLKKYNCILSTKTQNHYKIFKTIADYFFILVY